MEEFHVKANTIRRYNNVFTFISKTIRILELCIAFIFISWILTRLPFAAALSAQFLRHLFAFAARPLVVFALSNVIIAALVAQSRRLSAPNSADDTLYSQLLNSRTPVTEPPPEPHAPPPRVETEPVYHDKQVIAQTVHDRPSADSKYRRSQSEKINVGARKPPRRRQLRRAETEKRLENSPEILYPQDKLSNEEFQRTIEAFIAKQLRFRREESSAIVVQNPS